MFRSFAFLAVIASLLLAPILSPLPAYAAAGIDPLQADPNQSKLEFARGFAQKVLAIIQHPKESFEQRKDVLRRAFANSVDMDWIARFVLGKSWSNATPEQQEKYTKLYRKFLTETYVSTYAESNDKKIRDIKIQNILDSDADHFTVRTLVMLANGDDLRVDYRVRIIEGKYRIIDIIIENISLISTHRSEFSHLATSEGINGVITRLQQLLKQPASLTMAK